MANKEIPRILKDIESINWYRQGVEGINWFIGTPYFTGVKLWGYRNVIIAWHGRYNEGYFSKDHEDMLARKAILKASKDPKYLLENHVRPWRKICKEIDKIFKAIDKHMDKADEKKIVDIKVKLTGMTCKFWPPTLLIENFDPSGAKLFDEAVRSYRETLTKDEKDILLLPSINSFTTEELLDRLEIIENVVKSHGTGCSIDTLIKDSRLRKIVKKHADKYYWIENSWAEARRIGELEFAKKIVDDIQRLDELRAKRRHISEHNEDVKTRKKEILAKIKSKEMKNIARFYQDLADFREERKRKVLVLHHYLYEVLKEFSKRTGISVDDLGWLNFEEVNSFHIDNKTLATIEKRKKKFVTAGDRNYNHVFFYDEDADLIHNALLKKFETKEIKGVVANKGKVKGFARIVLGKEDFNKVGKGDIVIAVMTRPDYIHVMEKAAAFVTDEGGTTCHAAIVARELKKPCIVGTQTATLMLKDGDLIELDTDKGIVRKVK